MIITDLSGRRCFVSREEISTIDEAGASSQWHGVRAVIRLKSGRVIEATDDFKWLVSEFEPDALRKTAGR